MYVFFTCLPSLEVPQLYHFIKVCGSDGKTYGTVCHLYKMACKQQKDLVVSNWGSCSNSGGMYLRTNL